VTAVPAQLPPVHTSLLVQVLLSLHAVPSVLSGFEHTPVLVLHVPALWHWSEAVQTTGLLPVHVPLWQVSVCVHALPSLHAAPLVLLGFEHTPVLGLHVPAVWHWSEAVQTIGLLPTHVPAWHVSVCVQALRSLQLVPLPRSLHAVVLTAGWQLWHCVALTAPLA
jgi:hypothetical protein